MRSTLRPTCARALVVLGALGLSAAAVDDADFPAAQVDGERITLEEIDALAPALVRDVRARLEALALDTVQRLAAERAGSGAGVELRLPSGAELERPLAPDRVLTRAGGRAITGADFEEAAALRLYRLRGELHLARRRNLDELIERALLAAEARRRGIPPAALEASLAQGAQVSDAELAAYLAREKAERGRAPDAARARPYLEFRRRHERRAQLVERLRARADVRIHLEPPERPRLAARADGGLALTSSPGPLLVVFTNYRCRLCRATHRELDLLAATDRPPHIVLRDFVPPGDAAAMSGAAIARCAARAGRFEAARRALLASERPPRAEALASAAGLSAGALESCARSREILAGIAQDTQIALRLGFEQPPAFVADGVPLSGMQTARSLAEALDSASGNAADVDRR